MRIHHIRNATMLIEIDEAALLIDPMLGKKGSAGPPFTLFRYKPRRNPILDLPAHAMDIVNRATHCIITHLHPDHLDQAGEEFLRSRNIPVICSVKDERILRKRGLEVVDVVEYWKGSPFLGGTIEGIPAKHGYGFVAKPMGSVMGYFIEIPGQPSIYLSSDTIYTEAVEKVLKEYAPDISVVASGRAQLDFFQPLLMTMEDIIRFVQNAPRHVIANHLEAVNHCPVTREQLAEELQLQGLLEKTWIPKDGEVKPFNTID